MEEIIHENIVRIVGTALIIFSMPILRFIIKKLTLQYAYARSVYEVRAKLIIKYLFSLLNLAAFLLLVIIWGVDPRNILVTLSSVFAVIGVAMFAQWSILSNITAGVILFFTVPFKIGDHIKILDKDTPIEAEVDDIRAFHIHLRTVEGENIVYPNSLLLQKGIAIVSKNDEGYRQRHKAL